MSESFSCCDVGWWGLGRVDHGCNLDAGHAGPHICCCGVSSEEE